MPTRTKAQPRGGRARSELVKTKYAVGNSRIARANNRARAAAGGNLGGKAVSASERASRVARRGEPLSASSPGERSPKQENL